MRPAFLRLAGALLSLAVLSFSSGCIVVAVGAAGAAGAGTVAFVKGELDAALAKDYESVAASAEDAVHKLQFLELSRTKDALSETITARTAEDKKVTILVQRKGDRQTSVSIRVGVFGDERVSRAVLAQIEAGL